MTSAARIVLPPPHKGGQEKFFYWNDDNETAQVLVGPCGTKVGKSFGCALWLSKESLLNKRLYCVWIAPTYLKAKIGYRYMKMMLDIKDVAVCVDGLLEIRLSNGSFIKFLHGRDAEVTVEGEAVDRFVIDESGKISRQVWHSLLTTITQTGGKGIITGTPRGFNWYYDVYRQAKSGDPFFVHTTLKTIDSPYIKPEAIERARRLLPKPLFDQYYLALFVSSGSVFGDLTGIWDESLRAPQGNVKFWVHPDVKQRSKSIIHGVDIAKKRDYTVFFSVNTDGVVVGFCRFRQVPYTQQAKRFEQYMTRYFKCSDDNIVRFDCTGVGEAVGDLFYELDIDASMTPVIFTNTSKADMVTRLTLAIEQGWLKCPRIEQFEHELASFEVATTKTGLHSYNAAEGEHDDIVCAAMLAVSVAYQTHMAEDAEKILAQTMGGAVRNGKQDDILDYVQAAYDDDQFFEADDNEDDLDFDAN
jgi:hypothetical protein